ncbi:thioesterase, partial [Mycobacterium sp. ITM-2017-0098]
LVDPADPRGQRFAASEHVISTWGSSMQNAAPVSALLVRAIEHCAPRDDMRISRVVVDLLGPVPVTDELWVRATVRRPGRQIELVDAEMTAAGPDGTPRAVATASAWRFLRSETEALPTTPVEAMRPV